MMMILVVLGCWVVCTCVKGDGEQQTTTVWFDLDSIVPWSTLLELRVGLLRLNCGLADRFGIQFSACRLSQVKVNYYNTWTEFIYSWLNSIAIEYNHEAHERYLSFPWWYSSAFSLGTGFILAAYGIHDCTRSCSNKLSSVLYCAAIVSSSMNRWIALWHGRQTIIPRFNSFLVNSVRRSTFLCVVLGIKWWNVSGISRSHSTHCPSPYSRSEL